MLRKLGIATLIVLYAGVGMGLVLAHERKISERCQERIKMGGATVIMVATWPWAVVAEGVASITYGPPQYPLSCEEWKK